MHYSPITRVKRFRLSHSFDHKIKGSIVSQIQDKILFQHSGSKIDNPHTLKQCRLITRMMINA